MKEGAKERVNQGTTVGVREGFGVFRHPKKGTFGNRNFSKRLILQSVGKNEQMDAVSYCFGHFKAVFQILAVFGAVFGNWTPQKNGTSRTRKLNLRPL